MDRDLFDGFPTREGRKQTGQPQDVVQVPVGDQDVVEALKANPRFEDLALGSLSTVDHEPEFIMFDNL